MVGPLVPGTRRTTTPPGVRLPRWAQRIPRCRPPFAARLPVPRRGAGRLHIWQQEKPLQLGVFRLLPGLVLASEGNSLLGLQKSYVPASGTGCSGVGGPTSAGGGCWAFGLWPQLAHRWQCPANRWVRRRVRRRQLRQPNATPKGRRHARAGRRRRSGCRGFPTPGAGQMGSGGS
jgi:hypothetical protein